MGHLRKVAAGALAAGALALGGGCLTAEKRESKKPDVTQLGVLPPPQSMVKSAAGSPTPAGAVVQAGASEPAPPAPPVVPAAAHGAPSLSKLTARFEKKTAATEMGVGWQPRIAHLPDPARGGVPGPGIAGQLFLFGGPKLQFVDADGTLTVDLIDETPRPAGQPGAKAERWQFNKDMLLKMRTTDETFGRSYVLFLPWPAYRPDVTRVRIAARYDPDDPKSGNVLFAEPSVITLDASTPHGSPVWDGTARSTTEPIPLRGGAAPFAQPARASGSAGAIPLGGPSPGGGPSILPASGAVPMPRPASPGPVSAAPGGLAPVAPPLPPGLAPLTLTVGKP
jgi:hypothetical protein